MYSINSYYIAVEIPYNTPQPQPAVFAFSRSLSNIEKQIFIFSFQSSCSDWLANTPSIDEERVQLPRAVMSQSTVNSMG